VNESANLSAPSGLGDHELGRTLAALLTPFAALVLELLFWDLFRPFAWFLFYPAIFVSASLGGRRLGLVATALSAFLVYWFFLRFPGSLGLDARHLLGLAIFCTSGVACAFFQEKLTNAVVADGAKRQLEADLREMGRLQERLEKLAHERRQFAALIENSSDFIGIADTSGKPTYVNPAGRRLVGLSADFPVEETKIPDYYSEEQRAFAEQVILPTMWAEGHWQGETYFRHFQTGQAIPVSDRHFLVRDPETEELLGMATITRDISALRAMQAELQRTNGELVEARAFLENVLQSSTEYSIIAKDLDRHILAWNAGAVRNYGYQPSEVVGKSSDMLHVPEEVASGLVAELHRRALDEGRATGLVRRVRKDGSQFIARVAITRRENARGRPIGYLLVSHDVTAEQQKLARQQFLAEVGASLQSSLDDVTTFAKIAELLVRFVGDGCAIDVLEDIGKLERKTVVLANPEHPGLTPALERILPERDHPVWKALDAGRTELYREVVPELLRSLAKDDAHLASLEASNIRSALFVPLVVADRVVAVLTVVSCRLDRCYDLEDLRLAEELARRASLALDNARLYELMQEAVRARDNVLGVVAHDLRTPLGNILVATTLLRRQSLESERQAHQPLDAIERAVRRMNRLIQDLLDVTRIEASSLPLQTAHLSTHQVISEAVDAQRVLAASASLELTLELDEELPEICADRHRLLQILDNLIGNAVKFTRAGGHVAVGAAPHGEEVLFWVKDDGAGIAAEQLPHLFDRFWQAETAHRAGAGLGLVIVKGVVEAHGGRVWVESTPGRGSTFYFTIPLAPPLENGARGRD
jgi:PAS domain S-box-containing protein